MRRSVLLTIHLLLVLSLSACTGQLLDSFRYTQAKETFETKTEINTKIDMLWVVDNSPSMDIVQKNIREKLAGFANTYMSPSWDIRIGVITTDAYMANPVFNSYINATLGGSVGYRSKHMQDLINDRQSRGLNTSNDDRLQTLDSMGVSLGVTAGTFDSGFSYADVVPAWGLGEDYARLINGVRDGPISALCFELQPLFLIGNDGSSSILGPSCGTRDSADRTGTSTCLNPASGQNSVEECVNTTLNDSVRSGKAIIETRLPTSETDRAVWTEGLIDAFTVNISVGTAGGGSERGLGSVLEFVRVNEASETQFFRKGSLRGIIFLADEDDQSLRIPDSVTGIYSPYEDYRCDLDALEAANSDKFSNARDYLSNSYRYCCSGGSCRYENLGCSIKTVDGKDYKTGICPDESKLLSIEEVKSTLVDYFYELDEIEEDPENPEPRTAEAANFFAVSIVPTTAATIDQMRADRVESTDRLDDLEFYSGGVLVTQERIRQVSVDYGKRYIEFSQSVGNGSLSLDIGEPDYGVILDDIGRTLVEKKSTFNLRFAPTTKDEMIVKVLRADGSEEIVSHSQYEFSGKVLTITDLDLVLGLRSEDEMYIDYQPSSLD